LDGWPDAASAFLSLPCQSLPLTFLLASGFWFLAYPLPFSRYTLCDALSSSRQALRVQLQSRLSLFGNRVRSANGVIFPPAWLETQTEGVGMANGRKRLNLLSGLLLTILIVYGALKLVSYLFSP
jgi:hypothetical protein